MSCRVFFQILYRIWLLLMSDFRENLRQIKLTGPLDIYQVGYLGRALEVSVGSFFLENNLFLFKSLALVDSSVGLSREWKRADL